MYVSQLASYMHSSTQLFARFHSKDLKASNQSYKLFNKLPSHMYYGDAPTECLYFPPNARVKRIVIRVPAINSREEEELYKSHPANDQKTVSFKKR